MSFKLNQDTRICKEKWYTGTRSWIIVTNTYYKEKELDSCSLKPEIVVVQRVRIINSEPSYYLHFMAFCEGDLSPSLDANGSHLTDRVYHLNRDMETSDSLDWDFYLKSRSDVNTKDTVCIKIWKTLERVQDVQQLTTEDPMTVLRPEIVTKQKLLSKLKNYV